MSSVKLAIRVRPFTEIELRSEKDRVPVVGVVDNNTVTITNIKVSVSGAGDSRERVRKYYADYTFDSSCPNTHPHYASQEKVFEDIGREVIASVSGGRSACVLAYGQSATGKTHTMMGSDAHPGLIPRLCKALCKLQPFELTISFLEIYNERVHDLLAGEAPVPCHSLPRRRGNARKDLRVREHPTRGTYVQNLRRVSVQDAEALLCLVSEGARRRRTAATRRNCTSSRSHALIEIATPHATLHLADLAGSEKASWEGCGGGRQNEGANINKSLVALSNVISALVSGGSGRGRFVPYRDSALTWLLKDCFTGGARAFIIATVSPSVACYGESASTLRWAARARQLPVPRAVACASVASRAALQAQLNNLISELARNHIQYIPETGAISYEDEHWTLRQKDETSKSNDLDTATIGNIMNAIHPNSDANNSESTSSVASGSSDVINGMDKNSKDSKLTAEINKEIDELFGPALERTSSGDDFKVVAPLRNKRRQCRSQEVLSLDEAAVSQNPNLLTTVPSQTEMQINTMQQPDKPKVPVTILHENQRAEIVASVTERLYTKLKKKEEAVVSKVESIVDRKIVEPLSELKICTNARQRLMELSQKAIRNKRRIGIPAYTQTRLTVTRVRDQAIDAQTDLLSYIVHNRHLYTLSRDVATETTPMTPRCKEIAVGPTASLDYHDRATETKKIIRKNSLMMTDTVAKYERGSQTPPVVPPPRRKKRTNASKYVPSNENHNILEECSSVPLISINISQMYSVDSESQSSDDNIENVTINNSLSMVTSTPDLLTNHSAVEAKIMDDSGNDIQQPHNIATATLRDEMKEPVISDDKNKSVDLQKESDEFSDTDDFTLPRVTVDASRKTKYSEIKDIILGRNENVYPYNIVISPLRERDYSKRIVKFKDIDAAQAIDVSSQTGWELENNDNETIKSDCTSTASDKDCSIDQESIQTDSTVSSKMETDSFIWKKNIGNNTLNSLRKNYVPVYKSSKYKTTKARFYNDFSEPDGNIENYNKGYGICTSPDSIREISSSDSRERDTETKQSRRRRPYHNHKCDHFNEYEGLERKLFDSCNDLEDTANKYENYISNYRECKKVDGVGTARRPKDYLHHLLKLRREVVKAENDVTDSSVELSHE